MGVITGVGGGQLAKDVCHTNNAATTTHHVGSSTDNTRMLNPISTGSRQHIKAGPGSRVRYGQWWRTRPVEYASTKYSVQASGGIDASKESSEKIDPGPAD